MYRIIGASFPPLPIYTVHAPLLWSHQFHKIPTISLSFVMNPRPPGGFLNCTNHPNEPSEIPDSKNFCHPQFPQHLSFSQPSHAINFCHQQYPQQPLFPPNFHFVVVQPQYAPFSPAPPPPPAGVIPSTSVSHFGTPCLVTGPEEQDIVNIDNEENAEPERTARRLAWTEQEDLRLISAWLNNSKKSGMYWANVAAAYNSTTPRHRRREPEQLKEHWQKINKKIAHFYDCWCRVKAKYPSGQSDNMQLMDKTWVIYHEKAWAMYHEEAKHYFPLGHCWKAVWDQPKWKAYITSLSSKRTKLSESGDYTSSSKDTEDVPEEETCQPGCMVAKEKRKGKGSVSSSSSEFQEDIQYSVDFQTMLKDREDLAEVQLHLSDQNLDMARLKPPETKHKEAIICDKHSELLMADTSKFDEIEMAEHERAVREAMPGKETRPKHCKAPKQERVAREDVPKNESCPQGCKETQVKRKGKGKASNSSEVQEDIGRFVDLQTMLKKDRQEMSAVQLRLSKENLELARLKHQEAKDKKETILYEKYTELLMADTSRFNEFQKAEYQRAVRRMGEMLFGRDDK